MKEEKVLEALQMPYCHTIDNIVKKTRISSKNVGLTLDNLVKEGKVFKNQKSYYIKKEGTISINSNGYGFIKVDNEEKEYFVSQYDLGSSYSKDIVEFYILPKLPHQKLDSGIVFNVKERSNKQIFGKLISKRNKKGISYAIVSHDKKFDATAKVMFDDLNDAVVGSIVVGDITFYGKNKKELYAKVTKIIGEDTQPGVDISLIAETYGFVANFSDEVLNETALIPNFVDKEKYKSRSDFTNDLVITIDGDDAKDYDDAICVKKLDNGNFHLSVHIADVSEYVTMNSYLDKEALKRGTSVYLADRVIPMLPYKLSNGVCSLVEGEDRLVLSCLMEIDLKGNLVNYEIVEGIINSAHRMTYNNVNKILDGDILLKEKYSDLLSMIDNMYLLSQIIRGRREKKGALDFDAPEFKAILDNEGNPIDFVLRTRGISEMMIEDFMLQANETIAYHMSISKLPCLYRVHEKPDQERVLDVFTIAKNLGIEVKDTKKIMPLTIQTVMNQAKETKSGKLINLMMLRSMMKAKYHEENLGHYGLAFLYYCHFTSPIRRYPDLIVHRIIKTLIIHPNNFDELCAKYNASMESIGLLTSSQERKAIECEREVNDMLMATYMTNHIGNTFNGVISSVTGFGMFVMLENGIEGLIHISELNGFFTFDAKTLSLSNGNITYSLGQNVRIVVTKATIADRKVDFALEKDYNM